MDYEGGGRDLLSDLPLSLIHIILSLLPFKEAVRTSILSRQWRYSWASLPHLIFNDEDWYSRQNDVVSSEFEKWTNNFITNALLPHKGPTHRFEMTSIFLNELPDVNGWIYRLLRNDIRELLINIDCDSLVDTLSSIYLCAKLTKLELWHCTLDPPPSTFKGFLFLRSLVLEDVYLPTDGVESIISHSPLLEKLSMHCFASQEVLKLRISAPNLKYLVLYGIFTELSLHAPLLAELSLHLDPCFAYGGILDPFFNYNFFIGDFTNLVELIGDFYFTQYLLDTACCNSTLVFHHLKAVELYEVHFLDSNRMLGLARFITGAPNLCKLKISSTRCDNNLEAPYASFWEYGFAPDFALKRLRVVDILDATSNPVTMQFIRFLLECSPVLKTFNLVDLCFSWYGHARAEVAELIRAYSNVKISLLKHNEYQRQ